MWYNRVMLTQRQMRETRWQDSVANSRMKRENINGHIVHLRCGRNVYSHVKASDSGVTIRKPIPKTFDTCHHFG